jgi:hypothetical protein
MRGAQAEEKGLASIKASPKTHHCAHLLAGGA